MAIVRTWGEDFEGVTADAHQVLELEHFDIELKTTAGASKVPMRCREAEDEEVKETDEKLKGHVLEFSGDAMSDGVRAQMLVKFKYKDRVLRIKFNVFKSFNAVVQIFNQDDRFLDQVEVIDGEFDYSVSDIDENSIGRLSMFFKLDFVGPVIDMFEGYSWQP